MTEKPKPKSGIEQAADQLAAAADSASTRATYETARDAAAQPGMTPEQQLLAELALHDAAMADIQAMSADSRLLHEMDTLKDDE